MKNQFPRKIVAFALIFSFVTPLLYNPLTAPRAQALFGVGDINLESIPTIVDFLKSKIGKTIAQKMIDDIVKSSIRWANTGFEGNPAFVTNPSEFYRDSALTTAAEIIGNSKNFSFICSPFRAQIQLSLQQLYAPEFRTDRTNTCSFDQIGRNWEGFVNSFQEGDWEDFFLLTQGTANNPYDAFLKARLDTDQRILNVLGIERMNLEINSGFLSKKVCRGDTNPRATEEDQTNYRNGITTPSVQNLLDQGWRSELPAGACLGEMVVTTPGSVVETQLNKVLGSGLDGLIGADDIDSLISAFLSGMLQRHVFSKGEGTGLFSDSTNNASLQELLDVERDGLNDGYDYTRDGNLDICHHGLKDENLPPSNTNCILSSETRNSPAYASLCTAISETAISVKGFNDFINREYFTDRMVKDGSNLWINRLSLVLDSWDSLTTEIIRFENPAWDKIASNLSKSGKYWEGRLESLIADGDLKRRSGQHEQELQRLRTNTQNALDYVTNLKEAIGQCENPDTGALDNIPDPVIDDEDGSDEDTTGSTDGENTGGNTPTATSTEPVFYPSLSCAPNAGQTYIIGSQFGAASNNPRIVWSATSTFPGNTTYSWSGTEIETTSFGPLRNLEVTYRNPFPNANPKVAYLTIRQPGLSDVRYQCINGVNATTF